MKKNDSTIEFHVSPSTQKIDGRLIMNLRNEFHKKLDFKCSSKINILSVFVNNNEAFYSRSSGKMEESSFHIYMPSLNKTDLWSPIPKLKNKTPLPKIQVVITFTVSIDNPSLIVYPNFIATSNCAYGIAGWMPQYLNSNEKILEKLIVSTDSQDYKIIGPTPPQLISNTKYIFDIKDSIDLNFMGWVVGKLHTFTYNCFHFYSVDQVDMNSFSFIKYYETDEKAPTSHIVIVPRHSCNMEITLGFSILSSELLIDFFDFPSVIPIPSSYFLVAAVSYIIAYDRYGKRFKYSKKFQWLLHGIIATIAQQFILSVIGETANGFYEWVMLRYLFEFCTNNTQLMIKNSMASTIYANQWILRKPIRIKAQYVVQLITNYFPEDQQKLGSFENMWPPELVEMNEFIFFLDSFVSSPSKFIDFWIYNDHIPVSEISFESEPVKRWKSISDVTVHIKHHIPVKKDIKIPVSIRIFHSQSVVGQCILMDNQPKSVTMMLPKERVSKAKVAAGIVDSILFVTLETSPRVPLIINYFYSVRHLINLLKKYNASTFALHEALSSLHRILLLNGDDPSFTILNIFEEILNNDGSFFSIRCHCLNILANITTNEFHLTEASEARKIMVEFFLGNISDKKTTKFQKIDQLHPSIVISSFQAITSIIDVTEEYTSLDFLISALNQVSSSVIGPGILYCCKKIHFKTTQAVGSLVEILMNYMAQSSANPPLLIASIRIFGSMLTAFTRMVTEKILISFIQSFEDIKIHPEARIAIAESLFTYYPYDAFYSVPKGLKTEIESPTPNYAFLYRIFNMMLMTVNNITGETLDKIRTRSGLSEMFKSIHALLIKTSHAYTEFYYLICQIYNKIFSEKWEYMRMPNGLIQDFQMEYVNDLTTGAFSDSD